MGGSGKSGNNRKKHNHFFRHDHKKHNDNLHSDGKYSKPDKNRGMQERLHWRAPELPANPITTPDCPWCGKKITDITTAISDKETGKPVHFDCVIARITSMEKLDTNDSICYIGGGRFGVVHYSNPSDVRSFSIKKIYEWEVKERPGEWRLPISEYFSIT